MKSPDYIPQAQLKRLSQRVAPGKAVILYGPRRVGKTTLLRQYVAQQVTGSVLMVSGDDIAIRDYLESQSIETLKSFVGARSTLIVDEAQYVRQVGLNLKLLVDHVPGLRVIASGSSYFDLAQQTGEPLTGRKLTLLLLPLAQLELQATETPHETRARLEQRLIYCSYPEVVLTPGNEQRELYLRELVSSHLFKDILGLEDVRHSDKLRRLLQLLAFQIGKEVSIAELGTQLGMSKNTVDRYLDLLEKVFVIYSRTGFSRNLRKEITKNRRYYFIDNGIRNALINNFNPLALRDDTGALWENYVCAEWLKANLYNGRSVQSSFWRTYDQQEIDLRGRSRRQVEGRGVQVAPGQTAVPESLVRRLPGRHVRGRPPRQLPRLRDVGTTKRPPG